MSVWLCREREYRKITRSSSQIQFSYFAGLFIFWQEITGSAKRYILGLQAATEVQGLGQVRFWLIAVTKKALFYRRVSVCFAALFVFIIIRLKSQYFLCQLAFVSIGISIMCDQINFFSCQINSVCTVNNHSCEIRTGSFIDKTIFWTSLRKQIFERNMINICNADNDIQIGNPFSCFIIRVRLSWNIQFFTKLSLCKMMIFSKPLKIGCQLNIRHEDTSIYKKSEICLNISFIIPIFPVNGFICNLTKNIS